jgi:hypothetical protein
VFRDSCALPSKWASSIDREQWKGERGLPPTGKGDVRNSNRGFGGLVHRLHAAGSLCSEFALARVRQRGRGHKSDDGETSESPRDNSWVHEIDMYTLDESYLVRASRTFRRHPPQLRSPCGVLTDHSMDRSTDVLHWPAAGDRGARSLSHVRGVTLFVRLRPPALWPIRRMLHSAR